MWPSETRLAVSYRSYCWSSSVSLNPNDETVTTVPVLLMNEGVSAWDAELPHAASSTQAYMPKCLTVPLSHSSNKDFCFILHIKDYILQYGQNWQVALKAWWAVTMTGHVAPDVSTGAVGCSRGSCIYLINCLHWCHSVAKLHCGYCRHWSYIALL